MNEVKNVISADGLPKSRTGIHGLDEITLVRKLPTPIKKIIGDLSNTERVLVGLDLRPLTEE